MLGVTVSAVCACSVSTALSGFVVDRYSPRLLLLVVLIGYTLVGLLQPLAASLGYGVFLVTRVLFGLCDGMIWPGIVKIAT